MKPMMFVDVCMKDAEELREIAAHFDVLGKKSNGDFLREVANRHEILAGAYQSSSDRCERELKEWIDRSPTAEEKAAALKWLEDMRDAAHAVQRSSCAARSRRRSVRTSGGLDDDV